MTRRLAATVLALVTAAPATALAELPSIANETVTERSARKVVFTAAVDPGGEATNVRLEFGTTPALGARSSLIAIPAGQEPALVTITLAAQPGSTYHWRFSAANATGEATTTVQTVSTPAPAPIRRLRPPRVSFAVQLVSSPDEIGRLIGFTRPPGLPKGTKLTVRCLRGCQGERTITLGATATPRRIVRFAGPVSLAPRARVEVRAVRRGSIGRSRTYEFRRAGDILVPIRIAARCLASAPPYGPASCKLPPN